MRVGDILRRKGDKVVVIRSDETVQSLLVLLKTHGIGAVVVSDDGSSVNGIISERDVVRRLADGGAGVLESPVAALMTREVKTCVEDDDVEALANDMTQMRIRHLPVIEDGRLVAIVSIGDIVKTHIDDLKAERDQLVEYVQT